MNSIGKTVRNARERRGYANYQLAVMLRVSPGCITRWENGERNIPCSILPDLAKQLGCPELLKERLAVCPVIMAISQATEKEKTAQKKAA